MENDNEQIPFEIFLFKQVIVPIMMRSIFPFILFATLVLYADDLVCHRLPDATILEESYDRDSKKENYNDFKTNPYVSKKVKKKIHPHLLPETHPIKPVLDSIFLTRRASQDMDTFLSAGFFLKEPGKPSVISVAGHPLLPGYLVKVYLDTTRNTKFNDPVWKCLFNRIVGAKKIRKAIKKIKSKYFVVPRKWIYPLPIEPSPPNDPAYQRQNFVLVVEDMQLVPYADNLVAWKTLITYQHLDELLDILLYAGGGSYRPDNIAFTLSGKFAFIDTEYPHKTPNLEKIAFRDFLAPEMKAYWDEIIRN